MKTQKFRMPPGTVQEQFDALSKTIKFSSDPDIAERQKKRLMSELVKRKQRGSLTACPNCHRAFGTKSVSMKKAADGTMLCSDCEKIHAKDVEGAKQALQM